MEKGLYGLLAGLVAGVFVGAVGYELIKKAQICKSLSEGLEAAKSSFREGYRAAAAGANGDASQT